ncbi:hypothetical protein D9M72_649500 [compost metagenome]
MGAAPRDPLLARIAHRTCSDTNTAATSIATARRGDSPACTSTVASPSPDPAVAGARSATQAANQTLNASTASFAASYTIADAATAKLPKAR